MTQSHCSKTELTLHHQGLQDQRSHHHHRFSIGVVLGQNVIISLPQLDTIGVGIKILSKWGWNFDIPFTNLNMPLTPVKFV